MKIIIPLAFRELEPYRQLKDIARKHRADLRIEYARTKDEVMEKCMGHEIVIAHENFNYDKDIISRLEGCQLIVKYGIGYDNIDIVTAKEYGITVCNTPTFCVNEVAEHVVALMMCFERKIIVLDKQIRRLKWETESGIGFDRRKITRIAGKQLGLIGFGHIAKEVAIRARGLKIHVVAYDPYVKNFGTGFEFVKPIGLEDLLTSSDYVSIHVPLRTETEHMIKMSQLSLMKKTAVLINASRGAVVDEKDLIISLENKTIAGACLDVFEHEPISSDNRLLTMDNVILTPHFGAASTDAIEDQHCQAAQSIDDFILRRTLKYRVN